MTDGRGENQSRKPENLEAVDSALARAGINNEQRLQIYKILAAILHLGNIVFEEKISTEKCRISELTKKHFECSAHLLNIEPRLLEIALLTRTIEPKYSETIM